MNSITKVNLCAKVKVAAVMVRVWSEPRREVMGRNQGHGGETVMAGICPRKGCLHPWPFPKYLQHVVHCSVHFSNICHSNVQEQRKSHAPVSQ